MPPAGKAPWIYPDANLIGEDWAKLLENNNLVTGIADVRFILNFDQSVRLAHSSILCSVSKVFRGILNIAPDLPQVGTSYEASHGLGEVSQAQVNEEKLFFPIDQMYKDGESTVFRINAEITPPTFHALLVFIYSGQCEIQEVTKMALIRCSAGLRLPELEQFATNHGTDDAILNPSITTWLNDENAYMARDIFYIRGLGTSKVTLKVGTESLRDTKALLERYLEDSPILSDLILQFLQRSFIELNPHFIATRCPALYRYINRDLPFELGKAQAPFPQHSYEAMLGLLEYLYSGHMDIHDNLVKPLIVLSDRLKLKRLASLTELRISKYIERKVTNRIAEADVNVVELLLECQKRNMVQAVGFLKHFIATNYEPMSKTPEFELLKGPVKRWIDTNKWPPKQYYKDVRKYQKEAAAWDEKYGNKENNEEAANDAKLFGDLPAEEEEASSNCTVM